MEEGLVEYGITFLTFSFGVFLLTLAWVVFDRVS